MEQEEKKSKKSKKDKKKPEVVKVILMTPEARTERNKQRRKALAAKRQEQDAARVASMRVARGTQRSLHRTKFQGESDV